MKVSRCSSTSSAPNAHACAPMTSKPGSNWKPRYWREFHDLFRPGLRRALAIGIFLGVFNQFIGMKRHFLYRPVMFSDLGFAGDTQFLAAASVGGVELVATVVHALPDRHVRP